MVIAAPDEFAGESVFHPARAHNAELTRVQVFDNFRLMRDGAPRRARTAHAAREPDANKIIHLGLLNKT